MAPLQVLIVLVSLSSIGAVAARFSVLVCAAQGGASPATVGTLAALFAIVGAFSSVPAGRLIDSAGTRKPLLVASGLLTFAVGLGTVWRELAALVIIIALAGLSHNVMIIAFQRLTGDLAAPEKRAEAFGKLGFGFSISLLAAPTLAGFAIDWLDFAGSFALFTLVPIGAFLMVWTDRLPMSPGASKTPAQTDGTAPQGAARSGSIGLMREPRLRQLWICCAAFEAGWSGFNFMLPIVGTQLGLSASKIGLIAGIAGFTLFFTRGLLTHLLRRFSPWQLLIVGIMLSGTSFVGFALGGGFEWMLFCGALIGFGQGACSPMLNALIYEHSPQHEKGESMALRVLISNVAQGATPLVAGALSAAAGALSVFGALAAFLLGTAWSSRRHIRAGRTRRGG